MNFFLERNTLLLLGLIVYFNMKLIVYSTLFYWQNELLKDLQILQFLGF